MPYPGSMLLREHDIEELMRRFKNYRKRYGIMESCRKVSGDMGITPETVYAVQKRLRPTTEIATEYIRANALKLAARVVRKANVDQAMTLLSRPNIGVLDPQGEGGVGGGRQFMIGVAMDSLGSVKVGVQIGGTVDGGATVPGLQPAPDADAVEDGPTIDDAEDEEDEEPLPKRVWHQRDIKPKVTVEPLPLTAHPNKLGQSLAYRLAAAKRERKEAAQLKRKQKEAIKQRAKELAEELRLAREKV